MHVVIIGGGASGVLAAAQFARTGAQVTILDPAETLGQGVAYGTHDPAHLLNVAAGNMSAFADQPTHLLDWLGRTGLEGAVTPGTFIRRRSYGTYLAAIAGDLANLRHLRDLCVDLAEEAGGVTLRLASGQSLAADRVVLATGNDTKPTVPDLPAVQAWSGDALEGLAMDAPVLILGTGLTMVDMVLSLDGRGHRGPILAVSRRGLLPLPHATPPRRPVEAEAVPFGAPISALLAWLRRRAATMVAEGADWRSAIDALRPHTTRLWQAMTPDQRRRFLRHARAPWDIHRHRMPPAVHDRLTARQAEGRLTVLADRLTRAERHAGGITVWLGRESQPREMARIIDCTGLADDPRRTTNPLLATLLARGAARIDPIGLGFDFAPDGALIDATGRPSPRIHAIGPVTRAAFWEMVAIPDIRVMARALAEK